MLSAVLEEQLAAYGGGGASAAQRRDSYAEASSFLVTGCDLNPWTSSSSSSSSMAVLASLSSPLQDLLAALKLSPSADAGSCYVPAQRILEPNAAAVSSDEVGTADLTCRSALRVGDGWLEVLRMLVSQRYRVALTEHIDESSECRFIYPDLT